MTLALFLALFNTLMFFLEQCTTRKPHWLALFGLFAIYWYGFHFASVYG